MIDWRSAGLHTVRFMNSGGNNKRLVGSRFDGDPCSATFVRRLPAGSSDDGGGGDDGGGDDDEFDPYRVLGLDMDASESDIKRAFRKLSRKYHPDKNRGDSDAASMFERVREAYEVVGDPDNRILFDTGGMEAVEENKKQSAGGGGGMNPLSMLFGGGNGGAGNGRKANKGPDARVNLDVGLDFVYSGGLKEASLRRRVVCRGCKNKRTGKCAVCGRCPNEVRTVMRQLGPGFQVQQQEEVPSQHRCKEEGIVLEPMVEKGMSSGSEIRFERMSEQRPGQIPGDVVFVVNVKPHRRFRRDGDDLHVTMDLSLREALLGYQRRIEHLDGHAVPVSSNDGAITTPMSVKSVRGEGMPKHEVPSEYGDLHITHRVVYPSSLDDAAKRRIADVF